MVRYTEYVRVAPQYSSKSFEPHRSDDVGYSGHPGLRGRCEKPMRALLTAHCSYLQWAIYHV